MYADQITEPHLSPSETRLIDRIMDGFAEGSSSGDKEDGA